MKCLYRKSVLLLFWYAKNQSQSGPYKKLSCLCLKNIQSNVEGKHPIGRKLQSLAMRGEKLLTYISLNHDIKFIQSIKITSRPPSRIRKSNQLRVQMNIYISVHWGFNPPLLPLKSPPSSLWPSPLLNLQTVQAPPPIQAIFPYIYVFCDSSPKNQFFSEPPED